MAADKVLFVNDLVTISEREAGDSASVVYTVEIETKSGRQKLSLTPDAAQVLRSGLEHILKRGD